MTGCHIIVEGLYVLYKVSCTELQRNKSKKVCVGRGVSCCLLDVRRGGGGVRGATGGKWGGPDISKNVCTYGRPPITIWFKIILFLFDMPQEIYHICTYMTQAPCNATVHNM